MDKNGKKIKCKACGKEFYISASRFGIRKYCSRECAKNDNWGFKQRKKKCKQCGKEFIITSQLELGNVYCSNDCRYKAIILRSKEQSEKKKKIVVIKKCKHCGKEIKTNAYCPVSFCGGNTGDCYRKYLSEKRRGKKNPAYRNGFNMQGSRKYTGIHIRACSKYKKEFLEQYSYLRCESCGTNINGTLRFEVHHIYCASLHPRHKELHNKKNLILLCIQCHNDFHSGKRKEEFKKLEKDRGLKKLFY